MLPSTVIRSALSRPSGNRVRVGLFIEELIPTKANTATSHAVRAFGGIRKVMPRHTSMNEGMTNTGRLTPLRNQCPIRIPAMVAHTAGTRGRENIVVTG